MELNILIKDEDDYKLEATTALHKAVEIRSGFNVIVRYKLVTTQKNFYGAGEHRTISENVVRDSTGKTIPVFKFEAGSVVPVYELDEGGEPTAVQKTVPEWHRYKQMWDLKLPIIIPDMFENTVRSNFELAGWQPIVYIENLTREMYLSMQSWYQPS